MHVFGFGMICQSFLLLPKWPLSFAAGFLLSFAASAGQPLQSLTSTVSNSLLSTLTGMGEAVYCHYLPRWQLLLVRHIWWDSGRLTRLLPDV